MRTLFHSSFAKDLRAVKDEDFRDRVAKLIGTVEKAADIGAIPHLKKLRGPGGYYRVRLGEYRIGLVIQADTAAFVRFLHRKEIYRFFP